MLKRNKTVYLALENNKKITPFYNVKKWIFLNENYDIFLNLKNNLPKDIQIVNMSGVFETYYENIKSELLSIFKTLAKKNKNLAWWSGQVASHTSTGSNTIRNVIYAIFAVDIIKNCKQPILIICPDKGLLNCLAKFCRQNKIDCRYEFNRLKIFKVDIRNFFRIIINIGLFLYEFLKFKANIHVLPIPDLNSQKTIVIRSWLTGDTLTGDGKRYKDRNFGYLCEYLTAKGYYPVLIPLMFNTGASIKNQFHRMASVNISFLLPHHLLGIKSCFDVYMYDIKRLFISFRGLKIRELEISDILRYEVLRTSFDRSLMSYNLIYPLIYTLNKKGVDVECFIYPFENNASEKLFILAKQRFYPESKLSGFQHTVITSCQLGMELSENEYQFHPLPDRLICSGTIWKEKLVQNNFPESLLKIGPSLRFAHIRNYYEELPQKKQLKLRFFLALPYSQNLSYELIYKVNAASKKYNCIIHIKPHPLLNKDKLILFISGIKEHNFKLVDETPHSWFKKSDIVFEIGSSVTQIEAVAYGIPLIRIVPDNFFFFDPMNWIDYPIEPSQSIVEIVKNIENALQLDKSELKILSEKVRNRCFSEINDQSMDIFVPLTNTLEDSWI